MATTVVNVRKASSVMCHQDVPKSLVTALVLVVANNENRSRGSVKYPWLTALDFPNCFPQKTWASTEEHHGTLTLTSQEDLRWFLQRAESRIEPNSGLAVCPGV